MKIISKKIWTFASECALSFLKFSDLMEIPNDVCHPIQGNAGNAHPPCHQGNNEEPQYKRAGGF